MPIRMPLNGCIGLAIVWRSFGPQWHECEVPPRPLCRRYRGTSGSDTDIVKLTRITHEEFVSLRDCAKGLMHRTIPAEHKDRLIQLGYIQELSGGLRLTNAGRLRIVEGERPTNTPNTPRTPHT